MPIPGFAVLELVGNSRMGVAIYEAGNEGPNTFATGHIYIGWAIGDCWQCRIAWAHLPFASRYLGSD